MINSKHHVQAFTILEMMIAMLIAAIVIGITYTSYTIINKSYLSFKHKNEGVAILSRLDQLLKRDFENADLIHGSGNILTMQQSNKADINYEFAPDYIIRKANIIDTFKVSNNHLKMFFEKQEKDNRLTENISESKQNESNRIDEIIFNIELQKEVMTYQYKKVYSSENLINRNPYAIN